MQAVSLSSRGRNAKDAVDPLQHRFALAFAPIHKRYFGTAIGLASGVAFFLLTAVHLVRSPAEDYPLVLLAEYFYGYTVSWTGAVVGLLWGGAVGFVAGWFVAFCRNLALVVSLLLTRSSAELTATSDFLDHI